MAAYEHLATIYDEFMAEGQQQWAEYLIDLLRPYAAPPAHILDMGCGTGGISIPLAKAGYTITAMDSSPAMLSTAAEKARQQGVYSRYHTVLEYAQDFEVGNKVDAVVAACDVANYLPAEQLAGFLRAAKKALRPGGPLLFDISSAYYYKHILGSGCYADESENSLFVMRTEYANRRCIMDVTFFSHQDENIYRRQDERHELHAHEAYEVTALLQKEGFRNIGCYSFLTQDPATDTNDRIQFFALA